MNNGHRFVVTKTLQERLKAIGRSEGWTYFDALNGWHGGRPYAWNVAHGRQKTVPAWVYDLVNVSLPEVLHVTLGRGVSLTGKIGLLSESATRDIQFVVVESCEAAAITDLMEQMELCECAVSWCGRKFYRRVWNEKYCRQCRQSGEDRRWRESAKGGG